MAEGIKAMDGCEHIYVLASNEGPGLAILVWRDKAAMEAAAAQMAADTAQLGENLSITVTPNAIYDNFTEL